MTRRRVVPAASRGGVGECGPDDPIRRPRSRQGEVADSLCETCRHVREVHTPRSRFLLCGLSLTSPAYPKYPRQPVARCPGYRSREEGGESGSGGPAAGRS